MAALAVLYPRVSSNMAGKFTMNRGFQLGKSPNFLWSSQLPFCFQPTVSSMTHRENGYHTVPWLRCLATSPPWEPLVPRPTNQFGPVPAGRRAGDGPATPAAWDQVAMSFHGEDCRCSWEKMRKIMILRDFDGFILMCFFDTCLFILI